MNRKLLYASFLLLGIVAVAMLAFATFQPIQVLPRTSLAPGFSLVDQDGERLTSEDLRGSVVLYTISYTGCSEPCPQTAPVMKAVQDRLGEVVGIDDVPVRLVTISIDPERDVPEVLREAAAAAGAVEGIWSFATGEPAVLKNVVGGGFEVFYEERDDGGFQFDPAFFLVDGWGILRAEYRYGIPGVDGLLRDIGLVVKEARAATGTARLAYEAAHLFACYPKR